MISINFQRLSKLVSECAKVLGKTLSDPSVQRTIISAAGTSLATGIIVDQIEKKKTADAEMKACLYKDALIKQEAIIQELQANGEMSKERQDYLVELNKKLLEQIAICKSEDANEQI